MAETGAGLSRQAQGVMLGGVLPRGAVSLEGQACQPSGQSTGGPLRHCGGRAAGPGRWSSGPYRGCSAGEQG